MGDTAHHVSGAKAVQSFQAWPPIIYCSVRIADHCLNMVQSTRIEVKQTRACALAGSSSPGFGSRTGALDHRGTPTYGGISIPESDLSLKWSISNNLAIRSACTRRCLSTSEFDLGH